MNGSFDSQGFYAALDAHRLAKKLTWRDVAVATGVTASTLTRMGQGKRPDVDGLAALASWSGIDVRNFYNAPRNASAEPLAEISTILKADRSLSKESVAALEAIIRAGYSQLRTKDDET